VENWWIHNNPPNSPKTTWGNLGLGLTDPNTPIAVYARAVLPTNTLVILAPYLALAGLIAAVSAVVVVKKRR